MAAVPNADKIRQFKRILDRLAEKGQTKVWLARKLGYASSSRITKWRDGTGAPSPLQLRQIAELIDLPLEFLEDPMERGPAPKPMTRDEWELVVMVRNLEMTKREWQRRLSMPLLAKPERREQRDATAQTVEGKRRRKPSPKRNAKR